MTVANVFAFMQRLARPAHAGRFFWPSTIALDGQRDCAIQTRETLRSVVWRIAHLRAMAVCGHILTRSPKNENGRRGARSFLRAEVRFRVTSP
jgi:hypothetical protein